MKQKAVRFGLVSTIVIFMVITNLNVQSAPGPMDIGVSNGESFTYVVDLYQGPLDTTWEIAMNSTGEGLEVIPGDEFTVTVMNDVVNFQDDYFMKVRYDNGTHFVDTDNYLRPGLQHFSFIDWDYWIANMTADSYNYFGGLFTIENIIVQNGASEVRINVTMALDNGTVTIYIDQFSRYDKINGVANLFGLQTRDWYLINPLFPDIGMGMRLKGYDINTPFAPISTNTGTSTSSTATSTATTSTTTTTTAPVTSTTTTSTIPTVPTTTTTTTTSQTATTTSDTVTTTTVTNTDTNTGTSVTGGDDTTITSGVTDTATETSTSNTRGLSTDIKESTIARTTSTEEESTSEEPTSESPTATLPVPAFGPVMIFSGIMVALTIIRKRK